MKKSLFYSAAVVATMGLASCSSNEVVDGISNPDNNGSEQFIELAVSNAGDGMQKTRAGRPLNSSEAKQTIENVKIIVCDNSTGAVVADTLITDWMSSNNVINYNDASGHGRKVRFSLGGSNGSLEKDKDYTVYAFGYHSNSQYKVGEQTLDAYLKTVGNGKKWSNGSSTENAEETVKTFADNFQINNSENETNAEELFAGSICFNTGKTGKFTQGVTLHRQVAGIFSYVYKIPYIAETVNGEVVPQGTHLELWAAKENKTLILGNFYSKKLGNNGVGNSEEGVVNGINPNNENTLVYTINLNDFFTELKDVNNDGMIDRTEFINQDGVLIEDFNRMLWQKPERFKNVSLVKGSVFGGEFIIPFLAKSNAKTFVLALTNGKTDAEGRKVLRTWNIGLPDHLNGGQLGVWTGSSWISSPMTETKLSYSVLRNNLYGIGRKDLDDSTDPTDPTDPVDPTDPEQPEGLDTKQDIMLQVNDNWEVIHRMEVE